MPGRPRRLGSSRSWARVPPIGFPETALPSACPGAPIPPTHATPGRERKCPHGQEMRGKGGRASVTTHRPGRTMWMRQEEGLTSNSSTSPHTRPPPTPPSSSLLPSHYSLSPPGSSSRETPVYRPLGYYPWGLFTLGLAPTLSSSLQFGPDGYFSGRVLGGRAGEAERPGQAPRAQGDVEGSLQT